MDSVRGEGSPAVPEKEGQQALTDPVTTSAPARSNDNSSDCFSPGQGEGVLGRASSVGGENTPNPGTPSTRLTLGTVTVAADEQVASNSLRSSGAPTEVASGGLADGHSPPGPRDSAQFVEEHEPAEARGSVYPDQKKRQDVPITGSEHNSAGESEKSAVHVSGPQYSSVTPSESLAQDGFPKKDTAANPDHAAGQGEFERPNEGSSIPSVARQQEVEEKRGQGKEGEVDEWKKGVEEAAGKDVSAVGEPESPRGPRLVEADARSAAQTGGATSGAGGMVDRAVAGVREAVRCFSRSVSRVAHGDFTELQTAREGIHRIATGDFSSLSPLEQCLSGLLGDCSVVTEQVFPCAGSQPPMNREDSGSPKPPPILMVVSTPAGPYIRVVPDGLVDEAVKQGLVEEEDVQLQRAFPLYESRQPVV